MSTKGTDRAWEFKKEILLGEITHIHELPYRHRERVLSLRQWQITLLVAVFGLGLTQNLTAPVPYLMAAILLQFAFLELVIRGRMALAQTEQLELERLLLASDDPESILDSFGLAATRWELLTSERKLKAVFRGLSSPDYLSWNVSLLIVFIILVVLVG